MSDRTALAAAPLSPVRGGIEVIAAARRDGAVWRSAAALPVDAAEPVFAGHFPGRPVFPGVCLIDAVFAAARLTGPAAGSDRAALAAVESARFRDAVLPGDRVTIELTWSGEWRCTAAVSTVRGPAASVRLRLAEVAP
ncbi:hypothetical protein AB0C07_22580 [Actinoplanes missouriensis]|uniref:3-hydroxyacyl-ACP dehydratase FabZ family protein n=1 Tax=Actinoplanes missouriensis TaxID=1866 RepID=UPI003403C3A6